MKINNQQSRDKRLIQQTNNRQKLTNKYIYIKQKQNKTGKLKTKMSNADLTQVLVKIKVSAYDTRVRVMVFNATFNSILVISWRSILLVEETGVPRDKHRPDASHRQTVSHNVVLNTPRLSRIRTHN